MTDEPDSPSTEDAPAPTAPPQPIRSRPARRAAAEEPKDPANDPMAHIIAYLNALRTGGAGSTEELSPDAPAKSAAPLREKRLQRSAAGDQGMTEFVPRRTREEIAAEMPRGSVAKPANLNPPRREKPGSILPYVGVFALGLLAAAAVHWWPSSKPGPGAAGAQTGANSGRTAATLRSPEAPVSADVTTTTNRVLTALQAGNVAEAAAVIDAARSRQTPLPGLSYQGALLAAAQQDNLKEERLLDESIGSGEYVPECLYLRANSVAKTDYKTAIQFMEAAVHADPFSPRYYFFWGECLRRIGNPGQAIVELQEALKRRPPVLDADLIQFKLHLAMIEVGDPDFPKQLAAQMALPNVSGETLLLAAASEISQGNYAAAKPYFQKAARLLPPYVLWSRLRDYFFRAQGDQPDLAPLWPTLSSADLASAVPPGGTRAFVDPATLGLAEADPAIW